jgi:hypothetical protein
MKRLVSQGDVITMTERFEPEIANTHNAMRLEFRNVSMTFPDGTEALKEVSFSVAA